MSVPNNEEKKAIELFRQRVGDILSDEELKDDYFLLRWIRGLILGVFHAEFFNIFVPARELNLEKAEKMLRIAMKWRQENNIDEILDTKMDPFIIENYPRLIGGCDKEGRPLCYLSVGKWDLGGVIRNEKTKEFFLFTTEIFEMLLKLIKDENEKRGVPKEGEGQAPISQIIAIGDFKGFSWWNFLNFSALKQLVQFGSIYEAYYPEILHTCYFINAPSLISNLFLLLKPIISPKTMAKIKCFGTNEEEWKEELFKNIDADQLVPQLGGTKIE